MYYYPSDHDFLCATQNGLKPTGLVCNGSSSCRVGASSTSEYERVQTSWLRQNINTCCKPSRFNPKCNGLCYGCWIRHILNLISTTSVVYYSRAVLSLTISREPYYSGWELHVVIGIPLSNSRVIKFTEHWKTFISLLKTNCTDHFG